MFNTRPVSRDPCEAPHWFFFDSVEQEKEGVVTSYTREFPRNMTSCSFSGNISADPLALIRVFSPKTPKEVRSYYENMHFYKLWQLIQFDCCVSRREKWNVATWNMMVQMLQP